MAASLEKLTDAANALKQDGRLKEAVDAYAIAARSYPQSAVAQHNLAAALGDLGRAEQAEKHIRHAFSRGLNAPESWLVLARALLAQARLDEAGEAYEKAIELNRDMFVAHYEYAQLIWMRTADAAAAIAPLDDEIGAYPHKVELYGTRARVLIQTDGAEATFPFVETSLARWPNDLKLLSVAVDAATQIGDAQAALNFSERLMALRPDSRAAQDLRTCALLVAGHAEEAFRLAGSMCAADPNDQHSVAMFATAGRILGHPCHRELYDYDSLVRAYSLGVPQGWDSLDEYLVDFATALRARHSFRTHPFDNSERNGSKVSDLLELEEPAFKAFSDAVRQPLDAHLAYLGTSETGIRSRNTGGWHIDGIWSVWLRPEGFHHNHVHPEGWLSSACYIELPEQIDSPGQEGWLKFGEPGVLTKPKLPYEFSIRPEPGKLVIFPSYMWHGTIPFGGDEPRLTVAFDIVPDAETSGNSQ